MLVGEQNWKANNYHKICRKSKEHFEIQANKHVPKSIENKGIFNMNIDFHEQNVKQIWQVKHHFRVFLTVQQKTKQLFLPLNAGFVGVGQNSMLQYIYIDVSNWIVVLYTKTIMVVVCGLEG